MKCIKRTLLIACGFFACMNMAAFANAEQPGYWNGASFSMESTLIGSSPEPESAMPVSWNGAPFPVEGTLIAPNNVTDSIPADPDTGKRPGILDWAGSGMDTSAHPDGSDHDPMKCAICR